MMSEVQISYLNLVTLDGGIIEIEYTDSIMDEFLEDFRASAAQQGYWHVANFSDSKATFKGIVLTEINMAKVIGVS